MMNFFTHTRIQESHQMIFHDYPMNFNVLFLPILWSVSKGMFRSCSAIHDATSRTFNDIADLEFLKVPFSNIKDSSHQSKEIIVGHYSLIVKHKANYGFVK